MIKQKARNFEKNKINTQRKKKLDYHNQKNLCNNIKKQNQNQKKSYTYIVTSLKSNETKSKP